MILRRGVGGQHDFRMDDTDTALMRVIVGHSVPFVYQPFAASVGGSGHGGFALASPDDLNGTMKNRYAVLSPFGVLTAAG